MRSITKCCLVSNKLSNHLFHVGQFSAEESLCLMDRWYICLSLILNDYVFVILIELHMPVFDGSIMYNDYAWLF